MRQRRLQKIALLWRIVVVAALLPSMLFGSTVRAQSPEIVLPEGPLGEQVQWIIDVANGEIDLMDPAEGIAHFTPDYLHDVDIDDLVDMVDELLNRYGPVTLVSVTEIEPGTTAQIVFDGRDGTQLGADVVIDPESGLIAGLSIHEHDMDDMVPTASPMASPAANAAPVTWDGIEEDYVARREQLRAIGTATMQQFVDGDYQGIADAFAPELQDPSAAAAIEQSVAVLSTNRVHMEVRDLGAVFDGTWDGATITGFFSQRGATDTFSLTPDAASSATPVATDADAPTGTWSGTLDALGLAFSVTFTGDAANLTATFDVPDQGIAGKAMNAVSFESERPIGELVDESELPNGGYGDVYRALHAWGPGYLAVTVTIAPDGTLLGFVSQPQWALPQDPAVTSIMLAPMFAGAWETFWGGDSEFRNYHAATAPQRHAYDLVVWNDGASFTSDGLNVEDYYAYGMPLVAPVAGEIVAVEGSLPDQPPLLAQMADPAVAESVAANPQIPVGNHVVIRTADGLFVYLAHMQQDSVQVAVGDTVDVGDPLGNVGNTGNTSEPHIHVHVQTTQAYDDPAAIGVPITWTGLAVNGEVRDTATPEQGDIIEPAG